MIIAELKGKLSPKVIEMEDVLTSNVFSFFKYTDNSILKEYLKFLIKISVLDDDDFIIEFWPRFDDQTEPDVVIQSQEYYIVLEAKYKSELEKSNKNRYDQIDREIEGGKIASKNFNKKFVYILITAKYCEETNEFELYKKEAEKDLFIFKWTNWQEVATFLKTKVISEKSLPISAKIFAQDLYDLLIKKNLITFTSIRDLITENTKTLSSLQNTSKCQFFSTDGSTYSGKYYGFSKVLQNLPNINKPKGRIFFDGK
ncbi:MAG: hypothetical protein K9M99_09225 [Candidatus Cloacimonetes bacterium]|nr:hypothetical protein [Candidatus Cloacimonadota bacterium]